MQVFMYVQAAICSQYGYVTPLNTPKPHLLPLWLHCITDDSRPQLLYTVQEASREELKVVKDTIADCRLAGREQQTQLHNHAYLTLIKVQVTEC